jgi:hypothetical protein
MLSEKQHKQKDWGQVGARLWVQSLVSHTPKRNHHWGFGVTSGRLCVENVEALGLIFPTPSKEILKRSNHRSGCKLEITMSDAPS